MAIGGRSAVKQELADDEVQPTAVKSEYRGEQNTVYIPLKVVLDLVLAERSPKYVDTMFAKLGQEGVTESRLLHQLSSDSIQTRLTSLPNFSLEEVSDIISVREAIERSCQRGSRERGGWQKGSRKKGGIRGQKVSRKKGGWQKGCRKKGSRKKGNCRQRSPKDRGKRNGKGRDGKGGGGKGDRQPRAASGPAPELWKAVEEGDSDACQRILLSQGCDPDETHKLWTPLMKAAEEGHVDIALMLLERGADVNAKNKKGRDALSLAAAPSMNRDTTDGHVAMLRLLVEWGADPRRKDERGRSAKDMARQEGRGVIVEVMEELECGMHKPLGRSAESRYLWHVWKNELFVDEHSLLNCTMVNGHFFPLFGVVCNSVS